MPSSVAEPNRSIETVIPDCCNAGVIFRTLFAVNLSVLAAILLRTSSLQEGWVNFLESSILMEPACLVALLSLCGLRRLAREMPLWAQRVACLLVPAAVVGLLVQMFSSLELFISGFVHLTMAKAVLVAGLFGIALQHYFEMRTRAFSPALVEAKLQALQARIRPHFLFNSLNAVLSLIRTEPRRAESTLEDLADLFRVLVRDARDMTTMEEEIRLCKQYLSIEQVRLGDRLHVRWNIVDSGNEVLGRAVMPALLLQPLLENAVHHGVEPATEPVTIGIDVAHLLDRVEVTVVNPYHGDAVSTGNHMALENIRERLQLLYDIEAQLTTTVANGLFEVRLRFPYKKS